MKKLELAIKPNCVFVLNCVFESANVPKQFPKSISMSSCSRVDSGIQIHMEVSACAFLCGEWGVGWCASAPLYASKPVMTSLLSAWCKLWYSTASRDPERKLADGENEADREREKAVKWHRLYFHMQLSWSCHWSWGDIAPCIAVAGG